VDITAVSISPEIIRPGGSAVFHLVASQNVSVSSGILEASVHYIGFKVFETKGDLCEKVVECPFGPGSNTTLNFEIERLPKYMPPVGTMILTLEAVTEDEESQLLFCVDIVLPRGGEPVLGTILGAGMKDEE